MEFDAGTSAPAAPLDFVREIVAEDVRGGRHGGRVHTRFPPEPNGYLHIGHAKAICLDFGVANEFDGKCNLRFDDTNPAKEDVEYVESIQEDVRWLGFEWAAMLYASDYFDLLYQYAEQLIRDNKAYVDSLSADEIRQYRGTLTEPGRNSPYRDRSIEENLICSAACGRESLRTARTCCGRKLIWRRRTSTCAIRRSNRIRHATHHRTGDAWPITPRTITRTRCRTRSRESRTRSARSSSKIIGRCTTGASRPSLAQRVSSRLAPGK
jgi:glutaminyl-tRNA synthetase